jgi:hypothetical protein
MLDGPVAPSTVDVRVAATDDRPALRGVQRELVDA